MRLGVLGFICGDNPSNTRATHESAGADADANSPSLYSSCGGEMKERRNRVCSCAGQTHTHKCSVLLELAPKHIEETKCDSTAFSLPDSACACASVCVYVRAMVGTGRRCCSQLGWLGCEHSIMEAEQRDFIEALKSWKRFLWSRAVTVGHPALSSQTGFYWT